VSPTAPSALIPRNFRLDQIGPDCCAMKTPPASLRGHVLTG
jgi:hypothetical protein